MRFRSHLLILICLLSLIIPPGFAAPSRKRPKSRGGGKVISAQEARAANARKVQLRNQLHGLTKKMRSVKATIHEAKVKEDRIEENIETVEGRISATRAKLNRTYNRLKELENRRDLVTKRLADTEERLATRRRLLAQRVSDNYRRGQTSYAQVLLRSRSMHDMISRGYYVRQIVKSDAELIQGVKQDVAQIKADKAELEAQERETRTLAEQYEGEKAQYASELEQKQEILHDVQVTREQAEEMLDELEAESQRMTARIIQLSEMLRRRQEAMRRAAAARRRAEGKPNTNEETDYSPVYRGGFQRPAAGSVTSGFGMRYHPILHRRKLHTGVDFGAPYGAPIRAAGDGTVILATYNHGYGNCVIIDHGGGRTTLYGHASRLSVSAGQVVRRGEVIAYVGSTGFSTGPHLHFEVRINGVPVQPPF